MWWAACLMGLTGSLHCVVMCGPLVMVLQGQVKKNKLFHNFLYHTGRTLTYILLGLTVSIFGELFQFNRFQNALSIFAGVGMLLFVMVPTLTSVQSGFLYRWSGILSRGIKKQIGTTQFTSSFFFGLLNGLLPCGLVYMALIVAAVQSSSVGSIQFMLFFALGTIPALLASAEGLQWLRNKLPIAFPILKNSLLIVLACILIARGIYTGMQQATSMDNIPWCP